MPQRACGRRPWDLGLVAGCKLEFRYVPQPFGDHDAQFHSREVRAEAAMGPAAETPVPVQLPVHHHIITGRQVAAVAVDRPKHSRTCAPAGMVTPATVTASVVTRPTTGAGGSSRSISSTNAATSSDFPGDRGAVQGAAPMPASRP